MGGRSKAMGLRRTLRALVALLVCGVALIAEQPLAMATAPVAVAEVGQYDGSGNPRFTSDNTNNSGSVSARGFAYPTTTAFDYAHNRMFVADFLNHRVIVYATDSSGFATSPDAGTVLGQVSLITNATGNSAAEMNQPCGLAYDSTSQLLYVSERNNNRVIVFDTTTLSTHMSASYVLGQTGFGSNSSGATSTTMNRPYFMSLDEAGHRLFVADTNNSRVLVFSTSSLSNGQAAVHVLGQPDFTSNTAHATQTGLNRPGGAAYDAAHNLLWVNDLADDRILSYDVSSITDGQAATHVIGQTNFTNTSAGSGQNGFDTADGIALDNGGGQLFVTDFNHNRVLGFDVTSVTDGENATQVFGQADYTSYLTHTSSTGLSNPEGLTYDSVHSHLVSGDAGANRLMFFDAPSLTPTASASASTTIGVAPLLTFTVAAHGGSCNGVAQSSGAVASANAVALGSVTSSANGVGAQDLSVTSNAGGGFTVFLASPQSIVGAAYGHAIADVSGTNASPGSFPAAGTEAFGYTTSDATLGTGTANRFTNPSAKWAKLTSTDSEVSYAASGPVVTNTVCVAFQAGVSATTPADAYAVTAFYTATPVF